jgi:uncharacterized protein YyaL (SSP411 family)
LILRAKDFFDNATPSGNSVAAEVLLRIGLLTDNSDYQRRAATVLRLTASMVRRYASAFGRMLCALDFYLGKPKEIAIIGEPASEDTQSLLKEIWKPYLPNRVIAQASSGDKNAAQLIPLLRNRPGRDNKATAYVCEHFICKEPATTPGQLASQLLNSASTSN